MWFIKDYYYTSFLTYSDLFILFTQTPNMTSSCPQLLDSILSESENSPGEDDVFMDALRWDEWMDKQRKWRNMTDRCTKTGCIIWIEY